MFKVLIGFVLILIVSCNSNQDPKTDTGIKTETKPTVIQDSGFKVIKTNRIITAYANSKYTHKKRAKTQFDLDINSRHEVKEVNFIKISENKVIVCNKDNEVENQYTIEKKWIDKVGPSTVYNLIDDQNVECSLDYYEDYKRNSYLAFRYNKILQTYTDKE